MQHWDKLADAMFQSTPRLVGEGNPINVSLSDRRFAVSIHPPLGRRGEQIRLLARMMPMMFQSTPRLVGEGNSSLTPLLFATLLFQSTPRLVGEGNLLRTIYRFMLRRVSIHPPLGRRGERYRRMTLAA